MCEKLETKIMCKQCSFISNYGSSVTVKGEEREKENKREEKNEMALDWSVFRL